MTDYTGKRLLILGGAPQACKVVTTAKAMVIHTIVVDVNKNAAAKKLADESLDIGLYEYDELITWCMDNSSLDSQKLQGLGWNGVFDLKIGVQHTYDALKGEE